MPLIDAHLHLWDLDNLPIDWIAGIPPLNCSFRVEDWRKAAASTPLDGAVFVQAEVANDRGLEEAQWVDGLADAGAPILGIVAQAPLEDASAAPQRLDALCQIPRVKGIRRLIEPEPDAEICQLPAFVDGVRDLGRRGLCFDICISHDQLPAATRLASACPDTPMVLDHLGKPDINNGQMEPWASQLREFARRDNVMCKLSGLTTEADPAAWTVADLRPFVDVALDCFGPARVMFGSDWPVATLGTSYAGWAEAVDELIGALSDDEREAIRSGTARRFYRL